jgi:lipoate-protein ligase A
MRCRLLPFAVANGANNMAADQVLLETAAAGVAALRFYGWSEATLSLGYFQPENSRHTDNKLLALPYVRRPSGGQTLVHHYEVTYAIGLPPGHPWQPGTQKVSAWLGHVHTVIADALRGFGVATDVAATTLEGPAPTLCFLHPVPGDLLIGAHKIVGSAQRRRRGALLQHGAILLAASPYTPQLCGIRELAGQRLSEPELCQAIAHEFARRFSCQLFPSEWTKEERRRIDILASGQYAQPAWNLKR